MSKEINDKGLVNEAEETQSRHFIQNFIDEDIAPGGDYAGMTVHTRLPEPNGFLHIGHAKAIYKFRFSGGI